MEIQIKGNKKEIATAKYVMSSTCIFGSEYCERELGCKECEKKHLKINYIVEEKEN